VRKYYVFAAKAAGDILATILVPGLLVLVLKYAFHLPYSMFLGLLIVALIFTAMVLWKKITDYGRAYDQLNNSELRRPGS